MDRMLDSTEAARRLGVKVSTLYAYVSRGLIASHPSPLSRQRLFAADDVEALAQRARHGRTVETRLATVTTAVTQLRDEGPVYRGRPAIDLARSSTFETVAELLWNLAADSASTGNHRNWIGWPLRAPEHLTPTDRLRWTVVMAGASDPVRTDMRHEAVTRAARRLIASMVDALGTAIGDGSRPAAPAVPPTDDNPTLAHRLTDALSRRRADPTPAATSGAPPEVGRGGDLVPVVNAALILLADHELATSTLAVRVAASTRADLYDAILAGIGTIGGPLHGGAAELVLALLEDAARRGPEQAITHALRWRQLAPGFGHALYRQGDPRADALLATAENVCDPGRWRTVALVREAAAAQGLPAPNIDLALGGLAFAAPLPADSCQVVFTVARTAGWVAHYLEELGERPLRFRARAVYATSGARA